tara:strand:- start:4646 stop:5176 length:531 start_codon:yes stop_codon:yes gene_type:complete
MRKLKNNELNRLNLEEFKNHKKTPIVLILDDVRSAHNVGSVFRTSDAFLVEKIFLCGITPQPPHKEIRKTALGAYDSVDWEHNKSVEECVESLIKDDYYIIAIEQAQNATYLNDFKAPLNKKLAFVFGNEVNGVNQTIMDKSNECIEIPQYGTKHSFNISVSAGIVLWSVFVKIKP